MARALSPEVDEPVDDELAEDELDRLCNRFCRLVARLPYGDPPRLPSRSPSPSPDCPWDDWLWRKAVNRSCRKVCSELSTLAALLAPACESTVVAGVGGAVVEVLAALDVLVVVVVAGAGVAAAVVPVVAVPFAFVLVLPEAGAPGTRPSWLSAEKMLSMNPIIPPPDC